MAVPHMCKHVVVLCAMTSKEEYKHLHIHEHSVRCLCWKCGMDNFLKQEKVIPNSPAPKPGIPLLNGTSAN